MTPSEYAKARRLLMRRDRILGAAIKQIGPCGMADRQRKDHLTALVGAIVSQQLSTKAAATIFLTPALRAASASSCGYTPFPAIIARASGFMTIGDYKHTWSDKS